ncbi:ATP-binding protein [Streptosporangium sp. NPDC048047]|uniref:ATP-binding protein n=1 Tax=Streptosporangium sp. NPDC048047 TaxID=3155748 RepID=UPI0034187575
MAAAQSWKKPNLANQPFLKKLNDELHDLRLDAGLLSARTIRNRIGKDEEGYWIVNHQAVLDIFQKPELPAWERLEIIVTALAEAARRNDIDGEAARFKELWTQAATETITQAPVRPSIDSTDSSSNDEERGSDETFDDLFMQDIGDASQAPTDSTDTPNSPDHIAAEQFNHAEESLKGLIINAAQALWHDKDALRVFLGVVRRSKGFANMANAIEEQRPANATFYGVKSREFEVKPSPARLELIRLRNAIDAHRLKWKWSFTSMEERTGVSADAWIHWYIHDELPKREALVAFSHAAHLMPEDHILLLGLWDAAHDALERQKRSDIIPSRISFDEAWAMRDQAASKLWALAGVGDDGLTVYGPDLALGIAPAFVVAGPTGSGRSTALVNISRSLLKVGTRVVLAAPRPSPLRELADRDGVVACFVGDDIGHDEFKETLSTASSEEPIVVVMDDAEILGKCDARRLLSDVLRRGFDKGVALVLGREEDDLQSSSYWLHEVQKAHRGLLLSPQTQNAGDLIGLKIGSSITSSPVMPGRGWLHLGDGRILAVTVPY